MSTLVQSLPVTRKSSWKTKALDYATVLARWWVGGMFVYMGLNKALHPEQFLKLVEQYKLVDNFYLLNCIGAVLPWFEVLCGLLLIFGVAVRGTALLLVGMLVPFTVVVTRRALEIAAAKGLAFCAVKFDCGCGNGEVLICSKLVENSLMILIVCWLLAGRGTHLAARFRLLANRKGASEPKGL